MVPGRGVQVQGTSAKNYFLSVLAGVSLWAFASYFANMTRLFLDSTFGPVNLTEGINSLESSCTRSSSF